MQNDIGGWVLVGGLSVALVVSFVVDYIRARRARINDARKYKEDERAEIQWY